jgi:hypothetical protein
MISIIRLCLNSSLLYSLQELECQRRALTFTPYCARGFLQYFWNLVEIVNQGIPHTIVLSITLSYRFLQPSTETWEVILKLLLGICDCLLGGERGADEIQTKAIAPFLLKVLFEVWLHARTTDPVLWGSLVKLVLFP